MLEPRPSSCMATKAIRMPTGSMRMATSALRMCSRKTMQTSATTTLSSSSVCFSVSMARIDEVGAVVDRNDVRSPSGRLVAISCDALLDVVDHVERIGAVALQRDAACDLALAVEFGDAAPLVGAEFDAGHVAQQDRRAVVGLHDDLAEIVEAAADSPCRARHTRTRTVRACARRHRRCWRGWPRGSCRCGCRGRAAAADRRSPCTASRSRRRWRPRPRLRPWRARSAESSPGCERVSARFSSLDVTAY